MLNKQDIKDIRLLGSYANYIIHRTRELILANRLLTTGETYAYVIDQLRANGMSGETLGYKGYSRPFCISLNNNVLHGLNPDFTIYKEDDVIRLDMVIREKHLLVDCAITFSPKPTPNLDRNVYVAQETLRSAATTMFKGSSTLHTGEWTERAVARHNRFILPDFYGHKINPTMHAGVVVPTVKNSGSKEHFYEAGNTYTIEPVVTTMPTGYLIDPKDGWSVFCQDKEAVHVEDTFLVNETGFPENITKCHI